MDDDRGFCRHTPGLNFEGQSLVCEKRAHPDRGAHCMAIWYQDPKPGGIRMEVVFWDRTGKIVAVNRLVKGTTIDPPDWPNAPKFKPSPVPVTPMPPVPTQVPRLGELVGNPCAVCGSMQVVRTGSCETCQECGHNDGCG